MPSYPLSRDAGRAVPSGRQLEDEGGALGEQDNYEAQYLDFSPQSTQSTQSFCCYALCRCYPKMPSYPLSRDAGRTIPLGMRLETKGA